MHAAHMFLVNDRLSIAELSAARLDGHLVELGEGYIPADAIETAHLRASSLRELLGSHLAATHESAAWVHGAIGEPPARHRAQRAVARRLHHVIDRRLVYRDGCLGEADLCTFSGVWVTTPVRTLADLARRAPHDDDSARAFRALCRDDPGLVAETIAWFDTQGPVRDKRPALRLLRTM